MWKIEKWYAAAYAAKSLQSCLTLRDPIDGSPPGSPVPGILQARTLEWVAISFSESQYTDAIYPEASYMAITSIMSLNRARTIPCNRIYVYFILSSSSCC